MMNEIKLFQTQILDWYDQYGRKNLPWQIDDSYSVWISEVMLQQTQVIKVIDYFTAFIDKFPNMKVLAQADVNEVLAMWSGLGYYSRARNIHKTAQICQENYYDKLPVDLNELMDLPGIGRTTAGAILSLGSNLPFPILDGNVKRVMSRVHKIGGNKISAYNKNLWTIVNDYMPKARPKNYNQSLMDLGSMVCTRSNPHCNQCPLKRLCQAYKTNNVENFPPKKTKTKQLAVTLNTLLILNKNKILLRKRSDKGIWAGMWFLPEFSTEERKKLDKNLLFNITHVLSHRILTIDVYKPTQDFTKVENEQWIGLNELDKFAHPSALQKIINQAINLT